MERPSIAWSSSGQYPRIWLDIAVLDKDGRIDRLQKELAQSRPEGSLCSVTGGGLHLTLVHVGRPHELLAEIRKVGCDLDLPTFLRLLEGMIGDWRQERLTLPESLPVRGVELFGSKKAPVVVLRVSPNRALIASRTRLWRRLEQFLRDCGVADVGGFVKESAALRSGRLEAYKPHVSVLRLPEGAEPPRLDIPERVYLNGLQYHGVAFLPK